MALEHMGLLWLWPLDISLAYCDLLFTDCNKFLKQPHNINNIILSNPQVGIIATHALNLNITSWLGVNCFFQLVYSLTSKSKWQHHVIHLPNSFLLWHCFDLISFCFFQNLTAAAIELVVLFINQSYHWCKHWGSSVTWFFRLEKDDACQYCKWVRRWVSQPFHNTCNISHLFA